VGQPDIREVERFLYDEASLLDERRYEDWLALFTDDAHYWLPTESDADPTREASLIFDDRPALGTRAMRLLHPAAYSQTPPSKTSHQVTNVRVEPGSDGELKVHSTFSLFEARLGTQRSFGGTCEHVLRPLEGGWRIAFKKVVLVNSDGFLHNLTFMF